jgi:hypothetical protein
VLLLRPRALARAVARLLRRMLRHLLVIRSLINSSSLLSPIHIDR